MSSSASAQNPIISAARPRKTRHLWTGASAGVLLLAAQAASAVTLDFNGLVPAGNAPNVNPSYAISGYTLTAGPSTSIFLLDPAYDPSNAPPDNDDFFTVEGSSPSVVLTSGSGTFSLQSFSAAAIYDDPAGSLTVTGNLSGGGTVVQAFSLPTGNPNAQWNTYSLPANWVNLTSVTFSWPNQYLGLDNIVVDGGEPVPVMPLGVLAGLGVLLALLGRKYLKD